MVVPVTHGRQVGRGVVVAAVRFVDEERVVDEGAFRRARSLRKTRNGSSFGSDLPSEKIAMAPSLGRAMPFATRSFTTPASMSL